MNNRELTVLQQEPEERGSTSVDKEYQLAEYGRLTSEVNLRVQINYDFFDRVLTVAEKCATLAGLALTLAGLVIGVGPQVIGSVDTIHLLLGIFCYAAAIPLIFCPLLLAFLGGLLEENDLRIGQINRHLSDEHEQVYLPRGWERERRRRFPTMPLRVKRHERAKYHELSPRQGLKLLSMRGLFASVQVLFLMIALAIISLG